MVAAHISSRGQIKKDLNGKDSGQRDRVEECVVHETTLLPSIRGFGPLMAIIFAPAIDLKRDEWKSRFISLRTGLGYDEDKKQPYYAEHDTVFPLDFEFTQDDLMLVSMDLMIFFPKQISSSNLIPVIRSTKFVIASTHCCLHPKTIHNMIQ